MHQIHLYISGKVQGVGFRFATQKQAQQLGLVGFVQNLSDGRVEILAKGSDQAVEVLYRWLQSGGPSNASIEAIEEGSPLETLSTDFRINQ